jgi:hypothetical protein
VWFVAGAALLLVAFFVFAVRSSRGPDFAFLQGAKLEESSYFIGWVSKSGRVTGPPETIKFYTVNAAFEKVAGDARAELETEGWTLGWNRPGDLAFEGPDSERLMIRQDGYIVEVVSSRDATWIDRAMAWLDHTVK